MRLDDPVMAAVDPTFAEVSNRNEAVEVL